MIGGAACTHGVLDEDERIAALVGVAGRRLHAVVRRDAAQHDGGDAAAAQLQVEVGAVEGASLPLGHDDVALLWPELGHDVGEVGRGRPGRRRLVDRCMQAIAAVGPQGDVDQHDRGVRGAEGIGQPDRGGDDLGGRVRRGGKGGDAALQVDQDERSAARVET